MFLLAWRIRLCWRATGAPGKWLYSRAGRAIFLLFVFSALLVAQKAKNS